MKISYFRGLQYYVPPVPSGAPQKPGMYKGKPSDGSQLDTYIGTSLWLAAHQKRQSMISTFCKTLEGKVIIVCKTLAECEGISSRLENYALYFAKTKKENVTQMLDSFIKGDLKYIVTTNSIFSVFSGMRLPPFSLVKTYYSSTIGNFPVKYNMETLYHIVDNTNIKGSVAKFVRELKFAVPNLEEDEESKTCFKFAPPARQTDM